MSNSSAIIRSSEEQKLENHLLHQKNNQRIITKYYRITEAEDLFSSLVGQVDAQPEIIYPQIPRNALAGTRAGRFLHAPTSDTAKFRGTRKYIPEHLKSPKHLFFPPLVLVPFKGPSERSAFLPLSFFFGLLNNSAHTYLVRTDIKRIHLPYNLIEILPVAV